jgi:hypothetical protein
MRLCARVGRRGAALHQYQLCLGVLQRELGIEPEQETQARVSVVGREFEFALLEHLSGLGEEEVARAVEELTRRRLLQSVGEHFGFMHDRVREVTYRRTLRGRDRGPRFRARSRSPYAARLPQGQQAAVPGVLVVVRVGPLWW